MKTAKKIAAIITLLGYTFTYSVIFESNNFESVLQYTTKNSLVLCDIDNTIARPKTFLGSDMHFRYLLETKDRFLVLPDYCFIHSRIDLQLTSPVVTTVLDRLRTTNTPTVFLTARNAYIAQITWFQLHHLGIYLNWPVVPQAELVWPSKTEVPYVYINGTIFCGNNPKEGSLPYLMTTLDYKPSTIVFIDDHRKYLEAMQAFADAYGIEFIGIRYSACDDWVAQFDPTIVRQELELLKNN